MEELEPKRKKRKNERAVEQVENLLFSFAQNSMPFDPLGAYTGAAVDGAEPEQDADDL